MECIPVAKRKRGRPPKVPRDNTSFAIDFPASHLTEANARQIQFGYRILQDILKLSKTRHLVEKPDENLFGLHDYYTVIPKPFWFNEILRKFTNQEYRHISEVINDIRLVLENCYRYWGSKHRFSKQAFRIEKLIDKELSVVPQSIRDLCAIDNTSVDENINSNTESEKSFFVDDFSSKILKSLEKKERDEAIVKKETSKEVWDDLLKWESEVLMIKQHKKQITFMPELAEIGHFFSLCSDVLCIKKISQYEIERMLLMPKESSTLATLMTALLSPSAMRGSLYFKPIMVYEVWSKFLSRKVDTWYNNFTKICNKTQIFIRYGIETNFWEEVGETNPLINSDFATIPFIKRVWIMKTLCTTMFHSYKKIEEHFNSVDESCLRGPIVYEDGKFEYISLFTPEVRVYRICRSEMDIDSKGEAIAIIPVKNGFPPDIQIQGQNNNTLKSLCKKNKFYLAAYDMESLTSLIKVFSQKKKSLSALRGLIAVCEHSDIKSLDALISMKKQWETFRERPVSSISNSVKYWIEKEISPPISPSGTVLNHSLNRSEIESVESRTSSDTSLIGKRQLKRKFTLDEWENSSDSSLDLKVEEDTSDWEEGNIRQKGKRRYKLSRWQEAFLDEPFLMRPSVPRQATPKNMMVNTPAFPKPSVSPLIPTPPLSNPPTPQFPQTSSYLPPQLPAFSNSPFLPQSPQGPPTRPTYRPSYGRGRGRGMRMRFYQQPMRKLVRRPSIVASEITDIDVDQKLKYNADKKVLMISLKSEEKEVIPENIESMSSLSKLDSFNEDLLLDDLQAIKFEPPPWLQSLD